MDSGELKNLAGVINVRKEKDFTSHDVVAIIRSFTRGKVGHTGTLDPNATGVLPVCLGRATKLADFIQAADKTYVAEIILGITTDTGDMTGEIISQQHTNLHEISVEKISEAVLSFHANYCTEYLQTPPMYSAVKVGGRKLYELARKGEAVERQARHVTIHDIKILQFFPEKNVFTIEVTCSKGTYIRSLATDIGEKLGCGAAMGELNRTRSGMFDISTAVSIDEIRQAATAGQLGKLVLPIDIILPYPKASVTPAGMKWARNGNPLPLDLIKLPKGGLSAGKKYWLTSPDGMLIGLYRNGGGKMRPEVMM